MKPRDLAELVATRLHGHPDVASVEVAGPGFINLRLADTFWRGRLRDVPREGLAYADSTVGPGATVHVDSVSPNPTGPLRTEGRRVRTEWLRPCSSRGSQAHPKQ